MRVAVVGVAFIAMLSGFGAVNAPIQNLAFLKRPVTDMDIASTEKKLQQTMDMIFRKKKLLIQKDRKSKQVGICF